MFDLKRNRSHCSLNYHVHLEMRSGCTEHIGAAGAMSEFPSEQVSVPEALKVGHHVLQSQWSLWLT